MTDEILSLVSETDGPPLECRVVVELDLDEERYVLLSPVRRLVTIVRDDEDGLDEVPPKKLTKEAKVAFGEKLAQQGMTLDVTDEEYVLGGDLTEEAAELCDSITVGGEDDDETHLILADFEHKDALFLLLTPELPPLFPAKVIDGQAMPLPEDELAKVEERLASALERTTN